MLADVVAELTSTYRPLPEMVRGAIVDATEVAAALLAADPDSCEATVLKLLAECNPVIVSNATRKKA